MRFVCIKAKRYELQSATGEVLAKIQPRWVIAFSEKVVIPGGRIGWNPKRKVWRKGWWVIWNDGTLEDFKNLREIGQNYSFTNYPGYCKLLK